MKDLKHGDRIQVLLHRGEIDTWYDGTVEGKRVRLDCYDYGDRLVAAADIADWRKATSMDRAAWIDAFVMHMNKLGAPAGPQLLTDLAEAYFLSHPGSDPVKVAQWRVDEFGLPKDD